MTSRTTDSDFGLQFSHYHFILTVQDWWETTSVHILLTRKDIHYHFLLKSNKKPPHKKEITEVPEWVIESMCVSDYRRLLKSNTLWRSSFLIIQQRNWEMHYNGSFLDIAYCTRQLTQEEDTKLIKVSLELLFGRCIDIQVHVHL